MQSANIILAGAPGVGKTSIIHRYLGSSFDEVYNPTNGIKVFIDDSNMVGYNVFLTLSDIPYNKGLKLDNVDLVVLVFSLADANSFVVVKKMLLDIQRTDVPVVMVGNKCDILDCEVSVEELKSVGVRSISISTKRDIDIQILFEMIGNELIRNRHNGRCFRCQFCWHCSNCKCCITNN